MSRYDDEHFLLWFTRPTPTWLELSSNARGVAISVAMVLNPKTGSMTLRRGLASLAKVVSLSWEDELEPGLAELIAAGKLAWDGSTFTLFDPEHADRKRKSSTERSRDHRERKRRDSEPPADPECNARNVASVASVAPPDCNSATSPLISSSLVSSDLPDPDLPDRSPVRARGFETGTAAAVEAADAFESAVATATGRPYALQRAPYNAKDLCDLLNAFGPPGPLRGALEWLEPTVADWVACNEAKFTSGWKPSKLLDWLNAGRPDRREAAPTKKVADTAPAPYHAPAKAHRRVDVEPPSREVAASGATGLLGALQVLG